MIVVSNRNLQPKHPPLERFGSGFNSKGPDELRVAKAWKESNSWQVEILPDTMRGASGKRITASESVFLETQERARTQGIDILVYVHGFNDDFGKMLERCWQMEQLYGLEIILFSWPANGRNGSAVSGRVEGLLSYLSDKRDALRSVIAFDRFLEKLNQHFRKHSEVSQTCNRKISLLVHSMGVYLLKNWLKSSAYQGETSVFDNIILAAPDVNHEAHAEWVDQIEHRRRLYITINENDVALMASRMKWGERQQTRLGHYARNLVAKHAVYLDLTRTAHVGVSHTCFVGDPVEQNPHLRRVFHALFHGDPIEKELQWDLQSGAFLVR
ncbi:MAG: alpha/beta hydrolase [SAR324 cluster bacterium]|nr:alpha/beta hydrolase [SAR324 cluster bacterium]